MLVPQVSTLRAPAKRLVCSLGSSMYRLAGQRGLALPSAGCTAGTGGPFAQPRSVVLGATLRPLSSPWAPSRLYRTLQPSSPPPHLVPVRAIIAPAPAAPESDTKPQRGRRKKATQASPDGSPPADADGPALTTEAPAAPKARRKTRSKVTASPPMSEAELAATVARLPTMVAAAQGLTGPQDIGLPESIQEDTDSEAAPVKKTRKKRASSKVKSEVATADGVSTDDAATATKGASKVARGRRPSVAPRQPSPHPQHRQQIQLPQSYDDLLVGVPPANHPAWQKQQWVVFSDLHVTEKTWPVCAKVLDKVLSEAKQRDAGVIFLGDFWHHRETVPFNLLNLVKPKLLAFHEARVPLLMLVGNHDQINLAGDNHGISCIAGYSDMIHVFTHPTLFREALWISYRRSSSAIKNAIQLGYKPDDPGSLHAIMAHADVKDAQYNLVYQAKDGLSVDTFPQGMPVYTGHYHIPHTVKNSNITYIGSPYQVTRGEAGQHKRFLVLDAENGWKITEEIPVDIGPRYHKVSIHEARDALARARHGDELKLQASARHSVEELDALRQEAEAMGVTVTTEVERVSSVSQRVRVSEDASPEHILARYAEARASHDPLTEEGLKAAKEAIQDAFSLRTLDPGRSEGPVDLVIQQVQMEGFGPFVERTTYNLEHRGTRFVTGRNEDDALLADIDTQLSSNGAGKSTLVSAPLWALTGQLTTRTESGGGRASGLVGGVVNDSCNTAEVIVRGTVNGKKFVVIRSVKKKGHNKLEFWLGDENLTAHDKSSTEAVIARTLCTGLLRHQVFFGQNDITTLLEANDEEFKSLLGNGVELDIWRGAVEILSEKLKGQGKKGSVPGLKKQVDLMSGQVTQLQRTVAQQRDKVSAMQEERDKWAAKHKETLAELQYDLAVLENDIEPAEGNLQSHAGYLKQPLMQLRAVYEHVSEEYSEVTRKGLTPLPVPTPPPPPSRDESEHTVRSRWQAEGRPLPESTSGDTASIAPHMAKVRAEADERIATLRAQLQALLDKQEGEHRQLEARCEEEYGVLGARAKEAWDALNDANAAQAAATDPNSPAAKHHSDATRDHAAAKAEAQRLEKAIDKRRKQLSTADQGGECEACGQPVDREHVMKHLTELEEEHRACLAQLKTAKEAVHATKAAWQEEQKKAEAARQSAMQAYQDAQKHLSDYDKTRNNKLAKVREVAQAEQQRVHDAVRDVEQGVEKARAQLLQQSQAQMQELQKEINAEHRHREKVWKDEVAALRAAHEAEQRAAQAAYQSQVKTLTTELTTLQSLLNRVDSYQPLLKQYKPNHIPKEIWPDPWNTRGYDPVNLALFKDKGSKDSLIEKVERRAELFGEALVQLAGKEGLLAQARAARERLEKEQAVVNPHGQHMTWLTEELTKQESDLTQAQSNLTDLTLQRDACQEAGKALGREGIQSYVLEGVLKDLEAKANGYLDELYDGLTLELKSYKPDAKAGTAAKRRSTRSRSAKAAKSGSVSSDEDEGEETGPVKEQIQKIVRQALPNGDLSERDLTQLSGGERRRVALALALGFSSLIRDRGKLTCNLLVLDEGLQQLDQARCMMMLRVLSGLPHKTILMVAQAGTFQLVQGFQGVDVVVKSGGSAYIESDSDEPLDSLSMSESDEGAASEVLGAVAATEPAVLAAA